MPTELNFRANIYGFKTLGVERILSASAVGSLKEEYPPQDIVDPRPVLRSHQGAARARSSATASWPTSALRTRSAARWRASRARRPAPPVPACTSGGTYVCMEGPQFSTLAESKLYRSWGMDVIGMTNLQEAKLAREAEICYATLALVTDYDCWHPDHDAVTVEMIIANLTAERPHRAGDHRGGGGQDARGARVRLRHGPRDGHHHPAGRDPGPHQAGPRADYWEVHQVGSEASAAACGLLPTAGPLSVSADCCLLPSYLRCLLSMNIIVTGSIAYDYLMSFPGSFSEHLLPEHLQRVSLSFLVDSMDKRRGGCAPNIAYTLALLGERPRLMGTAGQDFGEYRQWLDRAGVDTALVKEVPTKFTASFFCSTDRDGNQIASFYTGAMAHAGEMSFKDAGAVRSCDHLAQRPGCDGAVRRGMLRPGYPVHLRSRASRLRA